MAVISFDSVAPEIRDIPRSLPSGGGTTYYLQRVYDSGTAGYCYYTKTVEDPTPLSGETSPNYTGSISAHSVVRRFTA